MDDIEMNPSRYPKHKGDKGQRFGGECNRTRCTHPHAVMFNIGTFGYYCIPCGRDLNRANSDLGPPLCTEVDHQLTLGEQKIMHDEDLKKRWAKSNP